MKLRVQRVQPSEEQAWSSALLRLLSRFKNHRGNERQGGCNGSWGTPIKHQDHAGSAKAMEQEYAMSYAAGQWSAL